eukprot:CAMPEP_0114428498 /NCGR_PEP_ID=MMETSP0103-20121206/8958_1 /TAXON_ID=37642 ORGANISM="Paraphysomonas imperforata, Strain PA2" /NCGR_SAMPLE_ID=MMETSP0103 /ASSEMBLY_ACC=CAM_ASM_000201 /LENGTH=35 /DNA_ID= /DNA_START= /DNA_END= /DNA_ORIENTATION=
MKLGISRWGDSAEDGGGGCRASVPCVLQTETVLGV